MQLIKINKVRYRKHLNLVIAGCIAGLIIGSLAISQTLIALFPNESGSHFNWNLLGVVAASLTIAWLLNKYRTHDFMREVVYVWELKQTLNKIIQRRDKPTSKNNWCLVRPKSVTPLSERLSWPKKKDLKTQKWPRWSMKLKTDQLRIQGCYSSSNCVN